MPQEVDLLPAGTSARLALGVSVLSSAVGSAYFAFGLPVAQFFYILAVFIAATTACFILTPRHIPRAGE